MLKKELCVYFLENMRDIENDLIKNSTPYWNGEDITMSLLSIKKTGEYPKAYRLAHKNKLHIFELNTGISTGNTHLNYLWLRERHLKKTHLTSYNMGPKMRLEC